jgi:hypothetical protein
VGNEVKFVVSGEDKSAAALTSSTKNVEGLSGSLKKMGETAGGINLADKFSEMSESAKAFLSNTTNAASGLEQSMGAVDSVFKGSADQIHEWGSAAAENVGLSERAFNESATSIGSLLNNLGFSMEETTARTGELTSRAADMAAMFGGDTSEAVEAISSALRGEADPIERYGVLLNEATVNARAMADTGKTSAEALTLQEKAAARLAIIMEQTTDAQGTFAREGDTVAGSQQRMTAAIEDAQAALGSMFAPVVEAVADVLTGLVGIFKELPGPIRFVVGALIILIAAAVAVAPAVTAAATAMGAFGVSSAAAAAGIRTVLIALGPIAAIAIAAGAAFSAFSGDVKINQQAVDGLKQALTGVTDPMERIITTMHQLQDADMSKTLNALGISTQEAARAISEGGGAFDSLIDKLEKMKDKTDDFGDQSLDMIIAGLTAERGAAADAAVATKDLAGAQEEGADSAESHAEALQNQTDALLGARDAQRGLRDAIADANDVMKDEKATTDDKEAALDNIASKTLAAVEATREAADANRDGSLSQKELVDSGNAMMETINQGRVAFIATARQMGLNEAQAQALADQLGLIPGSVYTDVKLLGAAVAQANLDALKRAIDNIPRTITVSTYVRGANISGTGGHQFVGQASGGITGVRAAASGGAQNGPTLINEADGEGELVELPSGSRVMTAGATKAYLQQGLLGGGGATQVNVSLVADPGADYSAGEWIQSLIRKGVIRLKTDSSGRVVVA